MNKIIEVSGFKKSYGKVQAVKGISFYVEQGKLFSFLGPNGAGKSTTIDTLCTLADFDSGSIMVNGYDLQRNPQAIRKSIGVVFQDSALDDLLTVQENLMMRARLYSDGYHLQRNSQSFQDSARDDSLAIQKNLLLGPRLYSVGKKSVAAMVEEVIDVIGLHEFAKRPYGKLSGGQRRRADIAAALLHQPRILFLDEPTTGLDPQTRLVIWDTIKKMQFETGMTIFLTTHYMEEAAKSDYVIVIDNGLIAAKGTPAELKSQFASDTLYIIPKESAGMAVLLGELLNSMNAAHTFVDGIFNVKLSETTDALPILDKCRDNIASFQVIQGTMDDTFIGITGRDIR